MIKTKIKLKKVEVIDKIYCDRCKKEIKEEYIDEMHRISFVGGYFSVFGDCVKVECDLCQDCLYEMITDFCRRS